MYNQKSASLGNGVLLALTDKNGRFELFCPVPLPWEGNDLVDDFTARGISATVLLQVSIWLAENGYMPTSDGGRMVLAG